MYSKKILTVRTAIVALIGTVAFTGLAPSAFAQATGLPTDQQDQTCTEEKYKALEAKLATCEDGNDTCAKALAACVLSKVTPPTPTPKPYKLFCGTGTTGQGGITIHNDKEASATTGSMHCTCTNPAEDKRITSVVGAVGKVEICMPLGLAANKAATKTDIAELRAMIDLIKRDKPLSEQQIEVLDPTLRRDIDELKALMYGSVLPDIKKVKEFLAEPDMEFFVAPQVDVGSRGNGVAFGFGATGGLIGWFNHRLGLTASAGVGAMIEPADSDQVSPFMTVQGMAGVVIAFNDDRDYVLGVGPWFRQVVRTSSAGDGVDGNFFGGAYGAEVDLRIQPWEAPVAIMPFVDLGYGPVAGWNEGQAFEMNAFQFHVGLRIPILTGMHLGEE